MARYAFDRFVLDLADRRLTNDGAPVELNARYLDALALLVGERGSLVTKDRFLEQVWRGVPVTDEALTQCIRTLRRALGDDAARPRFIETVPKHGYRFIAAIEPADPQTSPPYGLLPMVAAGTLGGGVAGMLGGLFYGFAGATQPGMGAVSVLLVLIVVTALLALIGAAAVSLGIALARPGTAWSILGGALGGLVIGAIVKLLGTDACALLFGESPGAITGAPEGMVLGLSVGLGAWLARTARFRRGVAIAALCGGGAGLVIALIGGRLMGGSLALLVQRFPASRLRLDSIGALLGESGFGPTALAATAMIEGALFAGSIVGAMLLARDRAWGLTRRAPPAPARSPPAPR